MKKILALVLAALMLLPLTALLSACGGAPATGVEDGVFTIAMECAYAPYNWSQATDENGAVPIKDTNEYANGYDIKIAKLICEKYGWTLEVVRMDWDSLVPAVQAGSVDAVIAGQSMTEDRMEEVDFAGPYLHATIVCLVKRDGELAGATSVADLAGKRCTSQHSTIWYDLCLPQVPNAQIQPGKDSAPDMLMALEMNAVDFVCTDYPTAQAAVIAFPDLMILDFGGGRGGEGDFSVSEGDINIGVSMKKGNTELQRLVNEALEGMTDTDFNRIMEEAIRIQPLSEESEE